MAIKKFKGLFGKSDAKVEATSLARRTAAGVFKDPQAGYIGNPNNPQANQNPEIPVVANPIIPAIDTNFEPRSAGKGFGASVSGTKIGPAAQTLREQKIIAEKQALMAQQAEQMAALQNLGLNDAQIQAIQSGVVESPIDIGQAATAGAAKVLPSIAGGAAGGAAIGAFAGGVGAIPGAVIGGVGGLIAGLASGVLSNIKSQQSGEIGATKDVLTAAKSNMRKLSAMAAKDPGNAAQYVAAYNQQLSQVYQAQRKLKLETSGNLNKFMNDGTSDLSDFDLFLQPNGQADLYRQQLQMALLSGQAPQLTVEDFETP